MLLEKEKSEGMYDLKFAKTGSFFCCLLHFLARVEEISLSCSKQKETF